MDINYDAGILWNDSYFERRSLIDCFENKNIYRNTYITYVMLSKK